MTTLNIERCRELLALSRGLVTKQEFADQLEAALAEIERARTLERLVDKYLINYKLDELDDPELCFDAEEHKALRSLADAVGIAGSGQIPPAPGNCFE